MTTGRIVEHDGATGTFSLPADHAAWLTRATGMNNLATGMQYIGLMATVEDQIADCFRHGGGVPYSAFPKFQAVMISSTLTSPPPRAEGPAWRCGAGYDGVDHGGA